MQARRRRDLNACQLRASFPRFIRARGLNEFPGPLGSFARFAQRRTRRMAPRLHRI
jgi:hypothetical protein